MGNGPGDGTAASFVGAVRPDADADVTTPENTSRHPPPSVAGPSAGLEGREAAPRAAPGATAEPNHEAAFGHFTATQARTVTAAVARLIPADDNGPGAVEAGVVAFIDRQLASGQGYRGKRYGLGPFVAGAPTQGDQAALDAPGRFRLGLEAMDAYARQVYQRDFAEIAPHEQDRILRDMEAGTANTFADDTMQAFPLRQAASGQAVMGAQAFFEILRAYTVAGFFADPMYGGNRDMIGWRLVGFPGAQNGYGDHILNHGRPFRGDFVDLARLQHPRATGA